MAVNPRYLAGAVATLPEGCRQVRLRLLRWIVGGLVLGMSASPPESAAGEEDSRSRGGGLEHVWAWDQSTGLPDNRIKALVRSRDGSLWIGTRSGLVRFRDRTMTQYHAGNTPALNGEINRLVEDAAGRLWIGVGPSLVRLESGRFETLGGVVLTNLLVNALLPGTKSGDWIGTARGVARFDGEVWRRFEGIAPGVGDDVNALAEDSRGDIWIGFHDGLGRWHRSERRFAKVDLPAPHPRAHVQALGEDAAGQLWCLINEAGASPTVYGDCPPKDGGSEARRTPYREQRCSSARSNSRGPSGRCRHEAGCTSGSIRRAVLSWRRDECIAMQSGGLLEEPSGLVWVGTSSSGLHLWRDPSYLGAIPFRSIGRPPMIGSQIRWGIAFLGAVAVGGLFHWAKVRAMRARQADCLAKERSRLARDLHDHVGSSLSRLALTARSGDDNERCVTEGIDDLARSLREAIWLTDPKDRSLDGYINALVDHAQGYLSAAGLEFRIDLPPKVPDLALDAEARRGLFFAAKEVLHNAVKHSRATRVQLGVRLESSVLSMAIEDDGKGFEEVPAKHETSGRGVPGLRTRLEELGGGVEIETRAPRGTRVTLKVPVLGAVADSTGARYSS